MSRARPIYWQYRARVTYYSGSGDRRSVSYRVDAEGPQAAKSVALRRLSSDRRRIPGKISAIDLFQLGD